VIQIADKVWYGTPVRAIAACIGLIDLVESQYGRRSGSLAPRRGEG